MVIVTEEYDLSTTQQELFSLLNLVGVGVPCKSAANIDYLQRLILLLQVQSKNSTSSILHDQF